MAIEILLSVKDDGIFNVDCSYVDKNIRLLIVHQVSSESSYEYDRFLVPYVRIVTSLSSGLSKSRNIALEASEADFLVFADDDIKFFKPQLLELHSLFLTNPSTDIIQFKLQDNQGEPFRSYAHFKVGTREYDINRLDGCSCELAISSKLAKRNKFDVAFGLGAKYPGFEEHIFIADAVANLKIQKFIFFDAEVAIHDDDSHTGSRVDNKYFMSYGAYLKRVKIPFVKFIYFALRSFFGNCYKLKNVKKSTTFFLNMLEGYKSYD